MDTDIGYVRAVGESLRAAGTGRGTGSRRPRTSVLVRLSAAAAVLAIAGVIGVAAGGGSPGAVTAPSGPPSGSSSTPAPNVAAGAVAAGRAGAAITKPAPPSGVAEPDFRERGADQRAGVQLAGGEPASSTSGAEAASGGSTAAGIPDVSKVIKTADLSIVVAPSSFSAKFQAATEVAEGLGGFVESSTEEARSGHLVMRVPARTFDEARRQLKTLAVGVSRETIDGRDVTAAFVDLRARLEILQARRDALVRLLHGASSLESILRLQNVVDDVLTRIEELKGEINLINDRTSNATIMLTMREKGVRLSPVVDKPSLGSALAQGVAGFLSVVYAVVVGLGYLVPIGAIALVAWAGVRVARRRPERPGAPADA
jgi:Domain of unknown function (DUF4349)